MNNRFPMRMFLTKTLVSQKDLTGLGFGDDDVPVVLVLQDVDEGVARCKAPYGVDRI